MKERSFFFFKEFKGDHGALSSKHEALLWLGPCDYPGHVLLKRILKEVFTLRVVMVVAV